MGPDILVPFFLFMTPVLIFFTQRYFRLREKQLEAQASGRLLLGAGEEQNKKLAELQARIENLESILIELDSSPRLQSRAARSKLSDGDQPLGALPPPAATPRLAAASTDSGSSQTAGQAAGKKSADE